MHLTIPPEQLREALEGGVKGALLEVGLIAEIREAVRVQLALHGELDKDQVAQHFGIKERALERWMKPKSEGGLGLPYRTHGSTVRFKLASIEAWSAEHEVNRVLPKVA
ncbi:MAG: hypothetical protein JWL59_3549 [Chthoniobacteraceae bacterium]|nr:hypothetical protein [Chthoniobacteraceae bacterium]